MTVLGILVGFCSALSLSSPGFDWEAGTWTAAAAVGTLASAIAAAVSAMAARQAVRESQHSQEHSGEERAQLYLDDALSKLGGDPGSLFLLEVKADPRDFVRAGQLIRLAIKAAPKLAWARIYHVGYLFHGTGRDKRSMRAMLP